VGRRQYNMLQMPITSSLEVSETYAGLGVTWCGVAQLFRFDGPVHSKKEYAASFQNSSGSEMIARVVDRDI
jgi:hypothetical protein